MKGLLVPFISAPFACPVVSSIARAANEPYFKANDAITLVAGEDMVACAEYGYLELFLDCDLPAHHLKVHSLAWEGDTVYEQPHAC